MALTLVKEDGSGLANANAYADVSDGDAYHEGRLYATAWTGATADDKAKALVMATRVLDASYDFNGNRAQEAQALQWPRQECRDPDDAADGFVASDTVPRMLQDATCELARELLVQDRTAAPPGEGLRYFKDGTTQTGYENSTARPIIPHLVQSMIAKLGSLVKETSGSAMFGFALLRGANAGLLDTIDHRHAAHMAWNGLARYVDGVGLLREVCVGTGQSQDRQFYLDRPRVTGDLHGQAPLLWFAAEMLA